MPPYPQHTHAGLASLVAVVTDIEAHLRRVEAKGVATQLVISSGLLQLAMVLKGWLTGLASLARWVTTC